MNAFVSKSLSTWSRTAIWRRWLLWLLLALCGGQVATAATCTSVSDGNWNSSGVWSGCVLTSNAPPADATVIINSTVTVNTNTAVVGSVTINSGKTLRLSNNATLSLKGNFVKTGTFTASTSYPGTVSFVGTTQSISGAVTFYKLSLGASTTLALSGNVKVSSTLTGTPRLSSTCPTDYTFTAGATLAHSCVPTCSAYAGQVSLNELRIGVSGSTSTSNQVELFNANNVPSSVWKTWQLKVYYKSKSSKSVSVKGPYPLSSGFTNTGQFIYNTTGIYLRNRSSSYLDVALVDNKGDFIDYLAITGVMQGVPSCLGTPKVVAATSSSSQSGDLARLPDGGNWPSSVAGTTNHTISRTNVCTASGRDLLVTHSVDLPSPILNVTPVTYTVSVQNKSCTLSIDNVTLNDVGISTTKFSSLSYSASSGTSVTAPSTSSPKWTIGTLPLGGSATLTITGTPNTLGALTATASATGTNVIYPSDDTASATITVADYNYVGFDQATVTVTEGIDTDFTAIVSANIPPASRKPITVKYTVTGTADSNDTDLLASGSVEIDSANDPSDQIDISFNIKDDEVFEPSKTIIITLTDATSPDGFAKLNSATSVLTIKLLDDDMPTLLAEYHLDSGPWAGGGTKDVEDSSGKGFAATAVGTIGLPKPMSATPALTGSSGTCGYASFGGAGTGQIISPGAVDLGLGGAPGMTVSAWVRWGIDPATGSQWATIATNGASNTGQFMLQHSQMNNRFEFAAKSSVARSYVQSKTTPVKGQWYHVVGVYDGAGVHVYVNGVLDDYSAVGLTGTVTPYASTYKFNIGADSLGNRLFQGDIDEVSVFGGALTPSQISALYANTHPCPTPTTIPPAAFTCVEAGADAATGHLYTKLVGTGFSVDVVALKADGSVETTYAADTSQSVTVELVDGSGSTACASRASLSPAVSQTLVFPMASGGRQTTALMTLTKAYPDLRCRVTDANQSSSVVGCSLDNFAARPASMAVTATANADATGSSSTALPVVKTGAAFTLTAASGVAGYNTTPQIDASALSAHAGASRVGALSGAFGAANAASGTASGAGFTYSEVGYVRLGTYAVFDSAFTQVDAVAGDCTADFSNTAVGGKIGCKFGNPSATIYIGRFIPDHFEVTVANHGAFSAACGAFTYTGQPMGYTTSPVLTITPMSAASGGQVTQNYQGSYQKLTPSGIGITAPVADLAQMGQPKPPALTNPTLTAVDADATKTSIQPGTLTNASGTMRYTLSASDRFTYKREPNALVPPYTSALSLPVASVVEPIDPGASVAEVAAAGVLPTLLPAGVPVRYGRARLLNAFGSELLDLPMVFRTEYWNGLASGWRVNVADTCSKANLLFAPAGATDLTSHTCVIESGNTSGQGCRATPSVANRAYLEGGSIGTDSSGVSGFAGNFNVWLRRPDAGFKGALDITAEVDEWLWFNWAGTVASPKARATFGIYGAKSPIIYRRENH